MKPGNAGETVERRRSRGIDGGAASDCGAGKKLSSETDHPSVLSMDPKDSAVRLGDPRRAAP